MTIYLSLLGYPDVERDGVSVAHKLSNKAIALLAFVVVENQTQGRERLATLLWPDSPETKAKGSLRQIISQLNQQLPGVLDVTRRTVAANSETLTTDVEQLQHPPSAARLCPLKQPFLDGFNIPNAADFESWQLRQRERLRQRLIDGWLTLAADAEETGSAEDALEAWQAVARLEPWREAAIVAELRWLGRMGRFDAAQLAFEQYRTRLQHELDVSPQRALQELVGRIEAARAVNRYSAPRPPGQLVGREAELAKIGRLLTYHAIITVTGIGGIGKTRLALAVAERSQDRFLHGACFVPLAAVAPDGGARRALATAIGRTLIAAQMLPAGAVDEAQLLNRLADRELLLILDNVEHLASGSGLLSAIAQRCPNVRLLITSRQRLGLQREQLIKLTGLGVSAEALFTATARRLLPQFVADEGVRQLCEQVGGMPLAVELAAGWMDALSAGELAEMLADDLTLLTTEAADRPERHRSIPALLSGTWRRLDPHAQRVLGRLAVFRNTFTTQAARAVADAQPATLRLLIGRSILQRDANSYWLHPLLRTFIWQRTAEQEAARRAHATYIATLLAEQVTRLEGADYLAAMDVIGRWEDDALAVWSWTIGARAWELIDQMQEALFIYFESNNRYRDGLKLMMQLADALPKRERERRAIVSIFQVWLSNQREQQNTRSAEMLALVESAELRHTAPRLHAQALLAHAVSVNDQLDFEKAYALAQCALAHAERAENGRLINRALLQMANCLNGARLNRPDEAATLYRRAADVATRAGNRRSLALTLHNWGWFHFYQENYERAGDLLREAAATSAELKQPVNQVMSEMMLARALAMSGKLAAAEQLVEQTLRHALPLGEPVPLLQLLTVLATEIYFPANRSAEARRLIAYIWQHPQTTTHLREHLAQFERGELDYQSQSLADVCWSLIS